MSHAAMIKPFQTHRNIKYLENGLHRHATHVFLKYTSTGGYAKNPIVHNRHVIPHDGERYHHGEAIATGFVESTVNEVVSKRFCKKQQMQWSKEGAHVLLQTRVRTLNGELGAIFKRWYPDMDLEVEEIAVAA